MIFGQIARFFNRMNFPLIPTLDTKVSIVWMKYILKHPSTTFLVLLATYILLLLFTFPLFLLSFLITGYGTLLLFCWGIVIGAKSFAKAMAFPGSSPSIQREVSVNYLKMISAQILTSCRQAGTIVVSTLAFMDGKLQKNSEMGIISKIEEIQTLAPFLFVLCSLFSIAIQNIKNNSNVSIELLNKFETFQLAIYQVGHGIQTLLSIIHNNSHTSHTNSVSFGNNNFIDISEKAIAHECMKSIENLVNLVNDILPKRISNDDYLKQFIYFVSSITYGPQQYELLMFPLLRQRLIHYSQAEFFDILGTDSNTISCVFLPALIPNPVGTVLFCCPNLGMIECIGLSGLENSWVGYYLNLGFNICSYNYRGYTTSSGSPVPDSLRKDVCCVLEYLRQQKGVTQIMIHGESIGGLSACHGGRFGSNIKLIICDRTFSSLEAAGSRILGNWAGFGLKFICRWNTRTYEDYLSMKCPKVLLQDPTDEVIAFSASLKSGLSSKLVLNSDNWYSRELPTEYSIAYYTNAALSTIFTNTNIPNDILQQAENSTHYLPEDFMNHLVGIILYIYKIVSDMKINKNKKDECGGSLQDEILTGETSVTSSPSTDSPSTYQHGRKERVNLMSTSTQFILNIWISISKIDSGGGYLLSHVLQKGFDATRAFLTNIILWNHSYIGIDCPSHHVLLSLDMAIQEIEGKLSSIGTIGTASNSMVAIKCPITSTDIDFLLRGLKLIHHRATHNERYLRTVPNDGVTSTSSGVVPNGEMVDIGRVIPLTCGHNGWPSPLALAALTNCIKQAGFNVET